MKNNLNKNNTTDGREGERESEEKSREKEEK